MADVKRNEKGQFVEGSTGNPNGRPLGSKNQYTRIKEKICDVFEERFPELQKVKMEDLLKFISATSPKETKVEVDTPLIIKFQDKPE